MIDDYKLHGRVGFKITRLARVMQAHFEALISEHGVTRLGWCVLAGVGHDNISSPSELATFIRVARPAMSRVLKEMEAEGLIKRDADAENPRSKTVSLTDEGWNRLRLCDQASDKFNHHFLSKLDTNELSTLTRTIDKLTEDEPETTSTTI